LSPNTSQQERGGHRTLDQLGGQGVFGGEPRFSVS